MLSYKKRLLLFYDTIYQKHSVRKNNTAILIFARSVAEELKYKPFLEDHALVHALQQHTVHTAKRSGLPVLMYDEAKQIGDDFGTRFSNAIQDAFTQGYDAIITIGNDSPGLSLRHIRQAACALQDGHTAIGPSYDGGFYLLGITKENFDYHAFLKYSWNTEFLCKEVLEDFEAESQQYTTLQKLNDLDVDHDLKKLCIPHLQNAELRSIILAICTGSPQNYKNHQERLLECMVPIILNKGSPLLRAI